VPAKIIYYIPRDEFYLDIIKRVAPEYYDRALEKYWKDRELKGK